MEDKPIKGLDIALIPDDDAAVSPIPRRKKSATDGTLETNGNAGSAEVASDGTNGIGTSSPNKKRTATEALGDGVALVKRVKPDPKAPSEDDDIVLIDDAADGAIVIED